MSWVFVSSVFPANEPAQRLRRETACGKGNQREDQQARGAAKPREETNEFEAAHLG